MKVLIFASATPHSPLTHRSVAIGRELVKRGHSVSMLAPKSDKYSNFKLDQPVNLAGISMTYPFQFRTGIQIIDLIPYILHACLIAAFQKADVSCIYKATPASIPGVITKWIRGSKLVLDMDDLDVEVMKSEGRSKILWLLVSGCEKLAARNADAIISASRLLSDLYAKDFPATPGIRVSNGVDPAEFPPASTQSRSPHIIFFGILGISSIMAPVIRSMPKVVAKLGSEAVHLDIIGDGPSRAELEQLTKDLGLESNVHFLGWATYDELQKFVAQGDIGICVMPRARASAACSNQKVFQYMSLGLAVVVSDVGDLPLYVENGSAGLIVPPSDPDALADAVTQLLADPELRMNLASQGSRLATSKFSWEVLSGQVEHLLEQIA